MDTSKISVLISIYPGEHDKYVNRCLLSIYNQTYQPDEIMFIIDGIKSSKIDDSVKKWSHKLNIVTHELKSNRGLGPALQFGLKKCKNEYVARADIDDINHKNRFELQKIFLNENPNISAVGAWISEFYNSKSNVVSYRKPPQDHKEITLFSKRRNPINHMTVMFRKSHILSVGGYEDMPGFEDYLLWLKLIKNGNLIANIPKLLVNADIDQLAKKRGGSRYMMQEINFIRKTQSLKLLPNSSILVFSFRCIFRILPEKIRFAAYKKHLRN